MLKIIAALFKSIKVGFKLVSKGSLTPAVKSVQLNLGDFNYAA